MAMAMVMVTYPLKCSIFDIDGLWDVIEFVFGVRLESSLSCVGVRSSVLGVVNVVLVAS